MATSHQPFVPSEYVKRWLTQVESEPDEGRIRHQQHPTRQRPLSPSQKPASGMHTILHIQHNDVPVRKRRSCRRKQSPGTEEEDNSDDNQEQEKFRPEVFDLSGNLLAEDHTSRKSRYQQIAPEDPSEKYARRPRHKTKMDRYEYKGDISRKSPGRTAMRGKHKRSRRKKTGDTLNEEFKAPNIEQERLTLKANVGPGIFGKGRASALLQTCGLPDLTFSEMNFLRKRRLPVRAQLDKHKPSNSTKPKDRAKEISGFFDQAHSEANKPNRTSSEVHPRQYSMSVTDWARSPAISSPAKLASNPQVSLVPEMPSDTGRRSRMPEQVLQHVASKAHKTAGPSYQQHISTITSTESTSKPEAVASTYCSWSATPSSHSSRKNPTNKPTNAEQVPSWSAQHPKKTPACGSPITNSSLDRYTKNVLLETDHEIWRQSHPQHLGSNVVSLDDLKGLARLAEIEERYSGILGMGSQHKVVPEPCYSLLPCNASVPHHGQSEFEHIKLSAASQLPEGNVTAQPISETVFVRHEVMPPSPLHLRDNQEQQALPCVPIPIDLISGQTDACTTQHHSARLDQARHHIRSSNTPDGRFGYYGEYPNDVQQIGYSQQHHTRTSTQCDMMPDLDGGALIDRHDWGFHQESSQKYGDSAQKTVDSGIPTLRATEILGFEEYASENFKANDTLPELYGLVDGEDMEDCVERYEQPGAYDSAQAFETVGGTFQDSLEQHISKDSERTTSAWKQYLVQYPFEDTEDEFQGFSRPQILY